MRVTVIPEDQMVIVDGAALKSPMDIDPDINAIQWYGDHGVIEYKTRGAVAIDDAGVLEPYLMARDVELARQAAAPEKEAQAETQAPRDAVGKLVDFLRANPDVMALLQ